jgi:tryptophan-rich sensory protein
MNTRYVNILKLVASLGFCFIVAFAGSAVTMPSISAWYSELNKPFFNPPNWIFGPVWTILYILMGIALYLVWNRGLKDKKVGKAVMVFIIQLALNFLWSLFFFGLHLPFIAFLTIIALWIMIFYTIVLFKSRSKTASWLLIPYVVWVSFAMILNLFIVILN